MWGGGSDMSLGRPWDCHQPRLDSKESATSPGWGVEQLGRRRWWLCFWKGWMWDVLGRFMGILKGKVGEWCSAGDRRTVLKDVGVIRTEAIDNWGAGSWGGNGEQDLPGWETKPEGSSHLSGRKFTNLRIGMEVRTKIGEQRVKEFEMVFSDRRWDQRTQFGGKPGRARRVRATGLESQEVLVISVER